MKWGCFRSLPTFPGQSFPYFTIVRNKSIHFINSIAFHLEDERGRWVLWIPIALGCGIAFYFALEQEPRWQQVALFSIPTLIMSGFLIWRDSTVLRFVSWAALWGVIGFNLIFIRTHLINPHPLSCPIGPLWITGTVRTLDHPASSHRLFQRAVLDIRNKHFHNVPCSVLLTIRTPSSELYEGDIIRVKATLQPIPGSCFPGGYNRQRQSFFQRIGATGFAMSSPRVLYSHPSRLSYWRHTLTRYLYERLSPPLGSIACGLVTGDKLALPEETRKAFADSGLAHLLAIAGLHVSLLTGLCFFVFQRVLAYIPRFALYFNLNKIAALLSLGVGWLYLMISGQRLPAQRAFFMMAATMLAMLIARRKNSMRILMLCAALFLIVEPELLISLSYQLSFTAVAGLIAFYETKMKKNRPPKKWNKSSRLLKVKHFLWDSLVSTGIITASTLPVMAFHFYHISLQGFLSNLIAIPFTAIVIIPIGVLTLLSLATPWSEPCFTVWGWSLQGLVDIAHFSAKYFTWLILPIPPFSSFAFSIQLLGLFWLLLWQSRWRWIGFWTATVAASIGHVTHTLPSVLIDSEHKVLGYIDHSHKTLWISSLRKGRYCKKRWIEAYGLHHVYKIPENKIFTLPHGKTIAIGSVPTLKSKVDFYLNPSCLDVLERKHDRIILRPFTCYAIFGSGEEIKSSYEERPWYPLPSHSCPDPADTIK